MESEESGPGEWVRVLAAVVFAYLGAPQLGYAIGSALLGDSSAAREPTTREQAMARELAETLSRNRAGLWLLAAFIFTAAWAVLS